MPIPSYANLGGTGWRAPFIGVTTTASLGGSSGPIQNVLDGNFSANLSHSCFFQFNQSGKEVKFDFRAIGPQLITELKWYQDSAHTQGTWKVAGSNDDSSYTDIATGVNLGGSATTTIDMSANATAYNWYKLIQTAGVTDSTPWIEEVEFKLDRDDEPGAAVQSYLHTGGIGARSSIITISSTLTFGTGAIGQLINGTYSDADMSQPSNFLSSKTITFDFGRKRLVTEAAWSTEDNSSGMGTGVQWAGSQNGSSWTNIGSTFNLIGSAGLPGGPMFTTQLNGNATPYRYYQLQNLTTGGGPPKIWEIGFKLDALVYERIRSIASFVNF